MMTKTWMLASVVVLTSAAACREKGPRETPKVTIENAVELLRERQVEACAFQFLTEDFRWGNRDRAASVARIRKHLAEVDDFVVSIQDLKIDQAGELNASFSLTCLVGLTVAAGSELAGLPIKGLRFDVTGDLVWNVDGWRIASFSVHDL